MHRSKQRRYSITSSARSRILGGIVRPSVLAVLAFTNSSNFDGCSMGKSVGFAPLRILATITPDCRHIDANTGPYDTSPPASTSFSPLIDRRKPVFCSKVDNFSIK